MTTSDGSDNRRVVPATRVAVAAVVGFGIVILLEPSIGWKALAGLVALAIICLLPQRPRPPKALRDPQSRTTPTWPDDGVKAAVEALPDPAFVLGRDLTLRYRNAVSAVAFGPLTMGDPVALRFRSPEFLAAIEAAAASQSGGSALYDEKRPVERHWEAQIAPIPAAGSAAPHFFLLLFRDRTAERRVERMRTDFVANASHELRTPLASLIGFIETLQGPAKGDAAARERFLGIMREQAARMSRLIDDLLSLSRIEMKRNVPLTAHVDLGAILAKVREQMAPLAAELGVTIDYTPSDRHWTVAGDTDELMQVFANLVENACKYGESGKRVVLHLSEGVEGGRAFIDASVQDFGPGIPPQHVPRLTERFYRVDVGNSRAKRGTGLGLSIVRNLLLRHRARLLIVSEPGQGSTFTARFPAIGATVD
ncbi:ATP-binding protein [Mangrovicella endophytica]|uniref:ATP-binding protein n=1 Tax=Mangrovicella endophytica TaxID=2066697 RepID=UPI001FDFC968|nr:ATP-binding protein [Mangrovicella endophytica]